MLINKASEVIKEVNDLNPYNKADQKREKELKPQIDMLLEKALPQWERLNELQPGERTSLETLQYIYTQLKKYDEAEAIMAELDKLGDAGE